MVAIPDPPPADPLTAEEIAAIATAHRAVYPSDTDAWKAHAAQLVTENAALRDRLARAESVVGALRNVEEKVYGTDETGHYYPMVVHRAAWDALWTAFYDYEERERPATTTDGAARDGER